MLPRYNIIAFGLALVLLVLAYGGVVNRETIGFASGRHNGLGYTAYGWAAVILGASYFLAAIAVLLGWGFPRLVSRVVWLEPSRDLVFFVAAVCFVAGTWEVIRDFLPIIRP